MPLAFGTSGLMRIAAFELRSHACHKLPFAIMRTKVCQRPVISGNGKSLSSNANARISHFASQRPGMIGCQSENNC